MPSRLFRLAAAALTAVALATPTASYAEEPCCDPPCTLTWGEPLVTGEGPVLEEVEVRRPQWTC